MWKALAETDGSISKKNCTLGLWKAEYGLSIVQYTAKSLFLLFAVFLSNSMQAESFKKVLEYI